MDMKVVCTFVLFGGAFILFLIGFSIPYWIYSHVAHQGLWMMCVTSRRYSYSGSKYCASYSSARIPDFLRATQAMEVIGLILGAFGLLVCFIGSFVKKERKVKLLAGVAAFGSAGSIIIGAIVFAAEMGSYGNLHAGFGLVIVAAVGLLLSAVLLFAIRSNEDADRGAVFSGGGGALFTGGGSTPGVIITPGTKMEPS